MPRGPTDGDPYADFLGLRFSTPGTTTLEIRPELVNGVGKLLGPVVFALADYTMAALLWSQLAEGELCATVNVAINFVDSADAGTVVCTARVDRRTRRAAALACDLRHADGRLLATAIGSFAIILPRTPSGPSRPA
jgi:acyl-CoA thioesterase